MSENKILDTMWDDRRDTQRVDNNALVLFLFGEKEQKHFWSGK